jgi:hypothetical protein
LIRGTVKPPHLLAYAIIIIIIYVWNQLNFKLKFIFCFFLFLSLLFLIIIIIIHEWAILVIWVLSILLQKIVTLEIRFVTINFSIN